MKKKMNLMNAITVKSLFPQMIKSNIKHVLNNHPHKRLYPSLSELAEMGLQPKGKRWRI